MQIDGVIDLGPNWNYEYRLETVKKSNITTKPVRFTTWLELETSRKKKRSHRSHHSPPKQEYTTPKLRVTQYKDGYKPKKLYFKTAKVVKDIKNISDFIHHVHNHSLKVFDKIKEGLNPKVALNVDTLAKDYNNKFNEFVKETMKQKIRTRRGPQRVILNTISTSNYLMTRLVNYFIGKMERRGIVRDGQLAVNDLLKIVKKEHDSEMNHICNKFNICRTGTTFCDFMVSVLQIILRNGDAEIKKAVDAATEVLKEINLSDFMDDENLKAFKKKLEKFEKWDMVVVKAFLSAMKQIFAFNFKPIIVVFKDNVHVTKTVALLELIYVINDNLHSNDENERQWTKIKNDLKDWSNKNTNKTQEIMTELTNNLVKNMNTLDGSAKRNINSQLSIIFNK